MRTCPFKTYTIFTSTAGVSGIFANTTGTVPTAGLTQSTLVPCISKSNT